jgi:hypothetical protein
MNFLAFVLDEHGTRIKGADVVPLNSSAPLGAGHHHIRIVAPATRTDEPLTPIGNGSLGTVSSRHFGGIGLNLMLAIPAPHDEANMGSRRVPERHRRAGLRLHPNGFLSVNSC